MKSVQEQWAEAIVLAKERAKLMSPSEAMAQFRRNSSSPIMHEPWPPPEKPEATDSTST